MWFRKSVNDRSDSMRDSGLELRTRMARMMSIVEITSSNNNLVSI